MILRTVSFKVKETLGLDIRELILRASELAESAYGAWEVAREDIFEGWMFATDPANLQPKIRPALRAAAEQLRKFSPPDMAQDDIDKAIESLKL